MTRATITDASVAGFVVAAWAFGRRPAEIALLALAAVVTVRAVGLDRRSLRLPNAAALAVVALAVAMASLETGRAVAAASGAVIGLAVAGGALAAVRAASRGRLGGGDVKFAAGLGALAGALHPFYAIVLAFAVMIAGAVRRPTLEARALGRAIAAAAAVALLAGPAVLLTLHLPVRWR